MPFLILRSFRSRILVLVLGLVIVVLTATVVAVVVKARSEVGRQAALQLRSAADTARETLKFRGSQLTSAVEVLTSDYGFREAVASGDTPTLSSAVVNYRSRIGADVLIVLDPAGRPIASTLATLSARTRSDFQELVAGDGDAQLLRLYRLIDGRPYQIVVSPLLAPDPVGWAVLGFALDDALAADLSRVLGVAVSFLAGEGRPAPFIASSLPNTQRVGLHEITGAHTATPFPVRSGDDEFLTWTNPIRSANGPLTLVLQQSLAGSLRPYQQLRNWLVAIGLAILVVASALAAWLARSATRPLDDLRHAAERLEAGDYSVAVPLTSTTELSRLASAFNVMRGAVAERERTIRHQAAHDSLTGLPNRARMTEVLDEALIAARAQGRSVAAFIVEIQQFKAISGSLGHAAADEVLREVAKRLGAGDWTGERVARIATDQFLVVLEDVAGTRALQRADQLGAMLSAPFDYAGVSMQLESRIGLVVFPEDGAHAAELLQRADLALFRAKESGASVGAFVRGDDEMRRERLAILGDLRRAISAGELELYYQPKASLPAGRVIGCEALVRWRHPQKGLIPPADFIPHAERTGLIRVLTAWVLETALRQLRCWQEAGLALDVAINLSAADLADRGLADSIVVLLAQTGADASRVVLEVTESGAMKDLPNTARMMEDLRFLGIRFSIDDFGTGYSSLAHLRRLPVDEIKIDRSFIRELETRAADDVIVRSTINLGHALNLKVVAEGVEVATSWNILERLGCDLVQGNFVSKPLPATAFTAWVTRQLAAAPGLIEARARRARADAPAPPSVARIGRA